MELRGGSVKKLNKNKKGFLVKMVEDRMKNWSGPELIRGVFGRKPDDSIYRRAVHSRKMSRRQELYFCIR